MAFQLDALLQGIAAKANQHRHSTVVQDVGTVVQVGNGVVSISGLPQAITDGLVRFPMGTLGMPLNLERDRVDCILFGSEEGIQGGDLVTETSGRYETPVGAALLGRVVDSLCRPLDGRGRVYTDETRFVEQVAPGVIERQPVSQPLLTGIKAIDALIPIGRGQRELIIGDRQTGKTTIALDTIINQRDKNVYCIYVGIGQKKSATLQVIETLREHDALAYTTIVAAAPDDPPALLYLAPYVGCTMAEYFRDGGQDALIVYDDLSKHADAYREISLLLRRPPGREAYPGDVFYLHSRLLERAGRMNAALGGGTLTALPIVETRRGNIAAYIPTNLISITDGQVYLTPALFNQGVRPAIDVGLSVSRVGGAAQSRIMRAISANLRLELSQYAEVAQFARFGTEVDESTRQQIVRGERLQEILKQPRYAPLPLGRQLIALYAVSQGYLDEVVLADISSFETAHWEWMIRRHPSIPRRLAEEETFTPDLERDLRRAIEEFQAGLVEGRWKI
jgi:F-type H+-transporting ATPase subunit alpha